MLCFSTIGEAVSALRKGYVDVVVAHESVIQSVVHGSPEKYRMLDQALFANELGVAFEKGTHEALAARLQAVIDDMRGDGSAGGDCSELRAGREKNAGGELMRRVFENLRGLYQRKVMKRFAWLRLSVMLALGSVLAVMLHQALTVVDIRSAQRAMNESFEFVKGRSWSGTTAMFRRDKAKSLVRLMDKTAEAARVLRDEPGAGGGGAGGIRPPAANQRPARAGRAASARAGADAG